MVVSQHSVGCSTKEPSRIQTWENKYNKYFLNMTNIFYQNRGGLEAQTVVFHSGGQGSIPRREFCYFFTFFQTLRVNFRFGRSRAKQGLCLSFSRGSRLPLHAVKIHVVLQGLYVTFVWKQPIFWYKIGQFLPFSYS